MNTGKITDSILKRSVLKKIRYRSDRLAFSPGIGRDAGQWKCSAQEIICTVNPVFGEDDELGERAFFRASNDVVCRGARLTGLMLDIALPEGTQEQKLKQVMDGVGSLAQERKVDIIGGHTQVTDVVAVPMISVTGIGTKAGWSDCEVDSTRLKPGMELVMAGTCGASEAARRAGLFYRELRERFSAHFLEQVGMCCQRDALPAAEMSVREGAAALHNISQGGVFGALWEMGAASRVGLEVQLGQIPIRQEVVEVCEFFDLNPYMIDSEGALLVGIFEGKRLVRQLRECGIPAAVIGKASAGRGRVVCHGDERRFLMPS